MVELLIKNAWILTMDEKKRMIRDGAIAVENDLIVDVGETDALKQKYKPDVVIDASGKAALPGLINTHMHICYCILKGIASDTANRLTWISSIYPYIEQAKPDDCYYAALLGCLEMIKGGTTYFVENNPFITDPKNNDSIMRAVKEIGIRAGVGRMFSDISAPSFLLFNSEELRSETERLVKTWQGSADGRIQIWIYAPGPGIRESPKRIAEILEIAKKYNLKLTSHWGESEIQDTKFLLDAGYLGPNTLLVHLVNMSDEGIQMLSETGTKAAHCPTANTIRSSRPFQISPAVKMLKAGVTVGLGTDAAVCNDNADMFEAMKQAVLLQKLREGDIRALTAEKALEMATVNGSKIVGMENQLGTLEIGKKADIILVNLKKPHIMPIHNITENIVYCANAGDVDTVIINGKIIMENREVKTVNENHIIEKVEKVMQNLDEKAKERAKPITQMWEKAYKERASLSAHPWFKKKED